MKVALCIPARDQVHTAFARSLALITSNLTKNNVEFSIHIVLGSVIAQSRNAIVEEVLETDADYLLWLDSDMHIPATIFERLAIHNKDITACTYSTRYKPYKNVAFIDEENIERRLTAEFGLHKVWAVGMGCMLVKKDVYKNLPKPYYNHTYNENDNTFSGEDIWFCKLANDHNYEIFIDVDVSKNVAHLGTKAFGFIT